MVTKIAVLIKEKEETSIFEEALSDFVEKGCEIFYIHTKENAALVLDQERVAFLLVDPHFDNEGLKRKGVELIELKRPLTSHHIKETCKEHLLLLTAASTSDQSLPM
jgi:hypothetical protein